MTTIASLLLWGSFLFLLPAVLLSFFSSNKTTPVIAFLQGIGFSIIALPHIAFAVAMLLRKAVTLELLAMVITAFCGTLYLLVLRKRFKKKT